MFILCDWIPTSENLSASRLLNTQLTKTLTTVHQYQIYRHMQGTNATHPTFLCTRWGFWSSGCWRMLDKKWRHSSLQVLVIKLWTLKYACSTTSNKHHKNASISIVIWHIAIDGQLTKTKVREWERCCLDVACLGLVLALHLYRRIITPEWDGERMVDWWNTR